jgi:hypothetical protein
MNFKQFMHQQQLNEGRNITLPPEVLAAIDQHLPEIMRQTCESKKTGQRFEMNLIEFNNKYIKKTYQRNVELNNIFDWDQMLKDPVMQEVKRQIDQQLQQQKNQLIKIVIDPKETKEMSQSLGWARTNEIQIAHSEKPGENINKIIDDNRKNIIGILDKYYSDEFGTYMRKLQAENNQEEINKEINNFCFPGIRYYFYEEIQRKQTLGIVNINEKLMCGKSKEEIKTLLIHEIIHCIDPKAIYRQDIKDPDHYSGPKDGFSKFKKYKSNKVEIEANIGEMVQRIFDLVNNSKNYQKTKSQIETIAQELRGAPKPSSFPFVNWMKNILSRDIIIGPIIRFFFTSNSNLESDPDFGMYTRLLTPEIRRKVLERLSNAVLQAKEMLETKYKNKKI